MPKLIDEIGNKYSRLTVIHKANNRGNHTAWLCNCDCGNKVVVTGTHLRTGHTKSCGCYNREQSKLRRLKRTGEASYNYLYARYKDSAKRRSILWNLNKDVFRELVISTCYYCGMEPLQVIYRRDLNGGFTYNGVDRLNPNLGYRANNVVPCCKQCNYAKRDMTEQEFNDWLDRVFNYRTEGH